MIVKVKRIYDRYEKSDGYRILVDRLWPRGVSRDQARIDLWMKDVAPTTELRKWFNHEEKRWSGFISKYRAELNSSRDFDTLLSLVDEHKTVTLLYSAKDEQHNQAMALKGFIDNG